MTKKKKLLKLCNALSEVKDSVADLRIDEPEADALTDARLQRIERNADADFRTAIAELDKEVTITKGVTP